MVCSIDYWELNAGRMRDLYAIAGVDECKDTLRDGNNFSTLDNNIVYCHLHIAKENIEEIV